MSNVFIVKNADFSANAVDLINTKRFALCTNKLLYESYDAIGVMDDAVRVINFNMSLPIGTIIAATNTMLYSVYKYAISKSKVYFEDGKVNFGLGTWDTSYSGAAYIQKDITLTSVSYYLYISRIDGATITEDDVDIVNSSLKIIVP